jgi:hypothetical protein
MNALTHLPLLFTLLFAVPVTVPEPLPNSSASRSVQEAVSQDAWEIPVVVFTPEFGNAHALANTLNQLFGDGMVSENGESRRVRAVAIESAIVLSGPQPYLDHAIDLLSRLDHTSSQDTRSDVLVVREYQLHHLTLDDARQALLPLVRPGQSSDNISFVYSRGCVIVRDTQERVDEIVGLLERLDIRRPQVLLRSYLIRGVEGAGDSRVPQEVTESLKQLVPYSNFELVSFGMLRSDVGSEMGMTDATGGAEYRMRLDPESYDAENRRLHFANCRFDIKRREGESHTTREFATSASLNADEYTVLGGVGADADFLVLHLTLVDEN